MYFYPFPKTPLPPPFKTYRNCIFIRVAEALVHLGLRLDSTLTIVEQPINLTKTLLGYKNLYFTLELIKNSGSYHTYKSTYNALN
jgi:hypothetical protein